MREKYALVLTDTRGDDEAGHGEGGEAAVFDYETQQLPPQHAFSIDSGEEEEEEEEDFIDEIEQEKISWNDGIFVVRPTNYGRVRKFTISCCALALLLMIFLLFFLSPHFKALSGIVSSVVSSSFQNEVKAPSKASDGYYQPFEPPEAIEHDDEVDADVDTGEANTSNQGDDGIVDDDYEDEDDHQADIDDPVPVRVDDDDDVSNSPLPVDNEAPKKDEKKTKGQGKKNGDNHDTEDPKEEEPFDFTPTELLPPGDKSNGKNCRYTPGVAMEEDPFEIAKGDWPWYPLTMHESSPPPDDPACSCWNNTAACCERGIHPNHKFGHHLLENLFGEHPNNYNFGGLVNETTANQGGGKIEFRYPPGYFHRPGNVDYREVFVWRNTYEAMVSGYLYHKAGYECWLTGYGRPYKKIRTNKKPVQDSWILNPAPHVPTEKREICQYLEDVSEYDGMRVYVEFVVRRYYYTTINMYKAVQLYEDPRHRRTLFVCFEDLNSHIQATKEAVIRRIIAWMFPGGQHADAPAPEAVEYVGGHATDHEATQRQRLFNIVKQLDEEVFGGALRNLNEMFGNCGGKI